MSDIVSTVGGALSDHTLVGDREFAPFPSGVVTSQLCHAYELPRTACSLPEVAVDEEDRAHFSSYTHQRWPGQGKNILTRVFLLNVEEIICNAVVMHSYSC